MAILEAVFADKPGQTPQEVERRRRMAQALMEAGSGGPAPSSGLELAGRLAMNLMGQYQAGKAEREDASNRTAANKALIDAVYGGSSAPSFASQARDTFTTNDPGAGATVSGSSKPINMDGNQIYDKFMGTVKSGGVNNPYALAAIAATGKAESGFSPQNANRSWSDPSQSGQAGTAGGIMSWRAERLNNLYNFARAKGEKAGAISPETQAAFFLQENPALIQRLNSAKSTEEAQRIMNEAWKFAGWNQAGGEAANRLGYANSFLPAFQGQPQQVASLDPSVGMPPRTASEAVTAMGAGGSAPGSLSDEVAAYQQTPEYAARFPGRAVAPSFPGKQADDMDVAALPQPRTVGALPVPPNAQPMPQGIPAEFAGSQQLANAQGGIVPALMGGTAASPEQIAQARALGAAQPQPQAQPAQDNRALIATLLGNPYTAEAGQQLLMQEMQRRQEASDPMRQMEMEKQRLELDALRNPQVDPLKVGEGETVIDPRTGQVVYQGQPKEPTKPSAVQEYEYAKEQGFPGTFQDWEASKKGGMSLQVDPATGAVSFQQGGNIKPMTEAQSKDAVFSTRAAGALPLIDQFGDALTGMEGALGGTVGQLPVVGNFAKTEAFQQAEQAGKEFLQAILRKDTGAAITSEETAEYGSVYLPRPGDSPQLLQQKKASRLRALEAIKAGMPPQAILAQEKALAKTQQGSAPSQPIVIDGYTIEEVE